MKYVVLCITLLVSGVATCAADLPVAHESIDDMARATAFRYWKISVAPLIASQILDVSSSYGMRELNTLLASTNGGFEMKGVTIKAGVAGAVVATEYLIIRKYPRSARVISRLNRTSGIVTTGFAVHNFAIKSRSHLSHYDARFECLAKQKTAWIVVGNQFFQ